MKLSYLLTYNSHGVRNVHRMDFLVPYFSVFVWTTNFSLTIVNQREMHVCSVTIFLVCKVLTLFICETCTAIGSGDNVQYK